MGSHFLPQNGRTPLKTAWNEYSEIAKLLKSYGATLGDVDNVRY